jgi:hypothetical protein
MQAQRTAGMTAVGIANIVFAAFGLALTLLGLGGAALALGLDLRQKLIDGRVDFELVQKLALPTLAISASAAMDAILLLSGIRVLQLAPRARTYCLVWAGLAIAAGVLDSGWLALHSGGWQILMLPIALLSPAYGVLLIVLFRRSRWKQAFAR